MQRYILTLNQTGERLSFTRRAEAVATLLDARKRGLQARLHAEDDILFEVAGAVGFLIVVLLCIALGFEVWA